MKRDPSAFPVAPHYNVQIPSAGALFAGAVDLRGEPVVHIRIGDYSHVAKAPSAIELAKGIIEQAEWAIKMADAWRQIREDHAELDEREKLALCTTCTPNIPRHVRTDACDWVYTNPKGALCGLCDGTDAHEHRGRQS